MPVSFFVHVYIAKVRTDLQQRKLTSLIRLCTAVEVSVTITKVLGSTHLLDRNETFFPYIINGVDIP